jgi:outer membrane protein assembly factor BamE (lipoprotein component of BamABCDE complex)
MYRYLKAASAGAVLLLVGCSTFVDQRGNLPDEDKLVLIKPGVSTRETVQQLLGTPSSTSTFDDSTWYYISKRTEQWAFLAPTTVDQQVVEIDFDRDGQVKEVRRRGLSDAKNVAMVDRATPTPGKTLGFLEQLFGNLGKFNTPEGSRRPSQI